MSIQKICAGFETTLSAKILAAGMSFSLSTHVNKTGAELNGEYGFIWDEGTSTEEWGYGTILNGVVTVIKRGLDPEDPETEVTALKFDHSRGSSLKITDYPFLGFVKKYLGGEKGLPSPLKYATHQVPVADEELVDSKYVRDVMAGIIGTANSSTSGTLKTTHNQGTNARAMSTLVRAQDTPNMTLLVGAYKHSEIDKNISFAGGNSPAFIDPDLAGDLIIGTNPSNAETFVLTINGTVCTFTFVSTIGATPGNVLIGATAAATRANLAALINTPGTTTANGVAFTGAQLTALGLINATDDLSSSIFIKSISVTLTTFTGSETMAAGGNTWTLNTTKKRIDLLVLQISDSTLQIRRGIEAVTPVAPTPTSGDIVLAQVYLLPGMTCIKDVTDGVNGYILAWYFPNIYQVPDSIIIAAGENLTAGDLLKVEKAISGQYQAKKIVGIGTVATAFTGASGNSFGGVVTAFIPLSDTRSIFIYSGSENGNNYYVNAICVERQANGTYLAGTKVQIDTWYQPNSARVYRTIKRLDDNSFIVSWSPEYASGAVGTQVKVCTVSNRVITVGTTTGLGLGNGTSTSWLQDAMNVGGNNWLFFIAGATSADNFSKILCGQISGTTITVGSAYSLGVLCSDGAITKLSATDAMVVYGTKYHVFTFNTGTNAITFTYAEQTNPITGTVFTFKESSLDNTGIVTYLNASTYATVAKFTVASGVISVSGTTVLTTVVASSTSMLLYDPNLLMYLYLYTIGGVAKIRKLAIINGNIFVMNEITAITVTTAYLGRIYNASSSGPTTVSGSIGISCIDYDQYAYICQTTTTQGSIVPVRVVGQRYITSSLGVGKTYYVGQNGNISTDNVTNINGSNYTNDILGVAVSDTELLLKK